MLAADFFWCQQSLGRKLSPELQALAQPTIEHLCWRFKQVSLSSFKQQTSIFFCSYNV